MKKWKIVLPTLLATSGLTLVSLVGCGNPDTPPEPEPDYDIEINLNNDTSDIFPMSKSDPFKIDINKTYKFNINASVCESATEWDSSSGVFFIYLTNDKHAIIKANVKQFIIRNKIFEEVDQKILLEDGKYAWSNDVGWLYEDYQQVDKTLMISIFLQFTDHNQESVTAKWGADD